MISDKYYERQFTTEAWINVKDPKSWNNGRGQEWVHSQFVIFTTHMVTDVYKQPSLKSILLCIHRLIIPA